MQFKAVRVPGGSCWPRPALKYLTTPLLADATAAEARLELRLHRPGSLQPSQQPWDPTVVPRKRNYEEVPPRGKTLGEGVLERG